MSRIMSMALLAVALVFGRSTAAAAAEPVQRSGNVFHVAVCARAIQPGVARCHAHVVTDGRGALLLNLFTRNAAAKIMPSGYSVSDLRAAYKMTASGSANTIVAIVDAYGYTNAEADLGVYRSTNGLPACTSANGCFTKYNQNGLKSAYPVQNVGWSQETALDLDMVSAMCPNCRIILVEANSANDSDLAAAVNRAVALGAHVVSNSYGGSETGTQSYETAYNHAGVAITASSGDDGYGVQFPASSPHVIAVGGTSLTRTYTTRGWSETAWKDAGSGCSKIYAKPTWQKDPLCTKRTVADVSAIADPNTGVAVYGPVNATKSAWQVYGGTSVAAPLIGAVYGANAGAVTYGGNPYINVSHLFDVTSGSNGSCGRTYFCTAGAGYDGPTGLGTPNAATAF
jgi:subtilase family serine protease